MNNREAFEAACELLPDGVTWGEPITPSIAKHIAALASQQKDHIPNVRKMVQSQAQQTESKLDCVKVTTGNHDKFHELLEAILNAGERVAMPVSFLSIINDAGMKFIKSLPPAPEGEKT